MDKKIQKKELKAKVKESLKQGNSKQETFEKLEKEYLDFKDYEIADIIRNRPTILCLQRLKTAVNIFTVIMIVSLAYKYIFAGLIFFKGTGASHYYFILPMLFTLLFVGLLLKDGRSIRNISFLGYFNIVAGIPLVMNDFVFMMVGDILLTIVPIVYSIYISLRMFPKYEFATVYGVNSKGQRRGMKVIKFLERK
ncbi:hypothetical protein [Candidatus Venteria ishoeyi]|uniref:Uncharacterized protein n=1 Tax=Candidatus Venteria ishoeyi TaxID=1899563 RepID=A0A1H6FBU5_9GAMM|nr:hypothetical protein [Candidatus Venteria ishoeyi]SEH06514.1 Uncharacterised protein [Candidatus Venteria ishoeyi]